MRFDTGSVPVGYFVLSSETRTIAEIQDLALFKCGRCFPLCRAFRPRLRLVARRANEMRVDPDRLRAYGVAADDVINARLWQYDQPQRQLARRRFLSGRGDERDGSEP